MVTVGLSANKHWYAKPRDRAPTEADALPPADQYADRVRTGESVTDISTEFFEGIFEVVPNGTARIRGGVQNLHTELKMVLSIGDLKGDPPCFRLLASCP
jgi:hypothetical protein